ncbi:hypothetical protein PG995_006104 [Apiospora arundinis]
MSSAAATQAKTHPDRVSEREIDVIALTAVFTLLASILVVARFIARKWTPGVKLWWDDWAILASMFASVAFLVLGVVDRTVGGAGYHIDTYSREQLSTFFQLSLAVTVVYNVSLVFSKLSVLYLYQRIFSIERNLFIWIQVMKGFLVAYLLAAAGGLIFTTNPVYAQWKYWIPHTTIDKLPFYITIGTANLLSDVVILAIPQSRVWKLQQSLKKRLSLSLVFLLGGFVCIASIVRLTALVTIEPSDLTYSFHNSTIWTLVEMNMSIICACLPTMPSAIVALCTNRRKAKNSYDSHGQLLYPTGSNGNRSAGTGSSSHSRKYEKTVGSETKREFTEMVHLQGVPSAHVRQGSHV